MMQKIHHQTYVPYMSPKNGISKVTKSYNYGGGEMHVLALQSRTKILGKSCNNCHILENKISSQNNQMNNT